MNNLSTIQVQIYNIGGGPISFIESGNSKLLSKILQSD